jgi:hypothetical protein
MIEIKCWISKGELSIALKNNNKLSKRDSSDDYAYIWFVKEAIPYKRGMVEVTLLLKSHIK